MDKHNIISLAEILSCIKLTRWQSVIFEIMDESRDVGDIFDPRIKKKDLIFALLAYEARITHGVNPFSVYQFLIFENPCNGQDLSTAFDNIVGDLLKEKK